MRSDHHLTDIRQLKEPTLVPLTFVDGLNDVCTQGSLTIICDRAKQSVEKADNMLQEIVTRFLECPGTL
jgi:hypothetical protein